MVFVQSVLPNADYPGCQNCASPSYGDLPAHCATALLLTDLEVKIREQLKAFFCF